MSTYQIHRDEDGEIETCKDCSSDVATTPVNRHYNSGPIYLCPYCYETGLGRENPNLACALNVLEARIAERLGAK